MATESQARLTAKKLQQLGIGVELTGFWHASLHVPNMERTVAMFTQTALSGRGKPSKLVDLLDKAYKGRTPLCALEELDFALSEIDLKGLMYWFDMSPFLLSKTIEELEDIDVGSTASSGIAIWMNWDSCAWNWTNACEATWDYEVQCIGSQRKGIKCKFQHLIQTMLFETQKELGRV